MGSTDREEKDRYTLEVQAKDGGNKVTAQIALCVLHFYNIAELNTSSSSNKCFILTSVEIYTIKISSQILQYRFTFSHLIFKKVSFEVGAITGRSVGFCVDITKLFV